VKRTLLLLSLVTLAVPGVASAARGVAVKVDRGANLVAVAQAHGQVSLLHVRSTARVHVGSRLVFSARRLANGTLAATRLAVLARAQRTQVRGTVLSSRARSLALSAHGAVLTIARTASTRTTQSSAGSGSPPVGSKVEIEIDIENEDLAADEIRVLSATADAGLIRGRLTLNADGTITVADDGVSLTFSVPAGLDLSRFRNGDEVLAFFLRNADGSLALKVLAGDDDVRAADDDDEDEDDDHGGGGHSGPGGGGDHD
jgi:hypothetical protein